MRYRLELEIYLPRARVIELFLDPDSLPKWQPDLVSFEHIGEIEPRQVGAQSKQVHKMGGRESEIIETITAHDDPDFFAATYEADGVWNLIENRLIDLDGTKTHWILDSEFRCSGITKLIAILMPGLFKKQTWTFMNRFKRFAEQADR